MKWQKQKKSTNPETGKKFTINKECSRVFQAHLVDRIWETNQYVFTIKKIRTFFFSRCILKVELENSNVFPLNINLGNVLLCLTKYACFFKLQTSQLNKRRMAHFSSRKPKPGTFLHVPQTQRKSLPSAQVMWWNCNASSYYLKGNTELGVSETHERLYNWC